MSGPGSLVCVGIGMTLGSHLTPLGRSYIEKADVVFAGNQQRVEEFMSDVIDFIERLGQDAHLHQLRGERLEQAMIAADLDPAARVALLSEDPRRLEALLHAPANLCCLIVESEGDESKGTGDSAT